MKKSALLAVFAGVLMLASASSAATFSFSWGTSFLRPSASTMRGLPGGVSNSLKWEADDWAYGILWDSNEVSDTTDTTQNTGTLRVTEITLDRKLTNSVSIGLGLGAASGQNDYNSSDDTFTNDSNPGSVVDVRGNISLLSGKGDKIQGSLDLGLSARFFGIPGLEGDTSGEDWSRLNVFLATLGVTLGI